MKHKVNNSNTQFLLARHGETEWNCVRRLQGRLDSPLTAQGVEQATNLANSLRDPNLELIVSSPLIRAHHSAQIIQRRLSKKLALDIKIMPELVERHFGDWQGHFFDDLVDAQHFESIFKQVTNKAPPGGEAGIACSQRIGESLTLLANSLHH